MNKKIDSESIHDWVASFPQIDSRGLDLKRVFVQKAVSAWLAKDAFEFCYNLRNSALDKSEIVYFAMREYMGGDDNEVCFWNDLKAYFDGVSPYAFCVRDNPLGERVELWISPKKRKYVIISHSDTPDAPDAVGIKELISKWVWLVSDRREVIKSFVASDDFKGVYRFNKSTIGGAENIFDRWKAKGGIDNPFSLDGRYN